MRGYWRCRARTRKTKNEKGKAVVEPCDHINHPMDAYCAECVSVYDPRRTDAGDLLKEGDVVKVPQGWHRSVCAVDQHGNVSLYCEPSTMRAFELKRLFPVFRLED